MPTARESAVLTLAAIRKPRRGGEVEYLFNERQRIFTLRAGARSAEVAASRLDEALRRKAPVRVGVDTRQGLIRTVAQPSGLELEAFNKSRILLEKPERVVRIDVKDIDPTTFNLVDRYLKFRVFRLCKRVIPNYKTAKKIFDYCAQQSCHLPGPKAVTPCIPFQYVRDGCYARAHKMRWIITTKYRYCCEKVFSFAITGNDRLAVKADKWGGCCVTWWYHVAPLVRVKVGSLFTLALVIDPGMFDKPVLLSTWLAAQDNTGCDPNARVSMYTIQPGTAYWPANGTGTAFGTDPAYVSTDATLNAYKNLVTC
jgi:hypothetical protein